MSQMSPRKVAALCVHARSHYFSIPGVECYDRRRDALTFSGGMPIVAHPPCRSFSLRLHRQAKPEPGEKELALFCCDMLRQWGGVLEHPCQSLLWREAAIPTPAQPKDSSGVWSMEVLQSWWGHPAPKRTWLAFCRIDLPRLPPIPFRLGWRRMAWRHMSTVARSRTELAFAEWLVECSRRVDP